MTSVHAPQQVLQQNAAPGGVALVVADGGFAEARDRHDQESVMVPLVAAQVLVAGCPHTSCLEHPLLQGITFVRARESP